MGKIIEIDTKKCFECGGTNHIHQHHIIPKSLGGTKTIPLCNICHGRAHGKSNGIYKNPNDWKKLVELGRKKYIQNGGKLGRTAGTVEDVETFLSKPRNQQIKSMLEQGYSVRLISNDLHASASTIIKVKKIAGITKKPTIGRVRKYRPAKRISDYCKNK